MNNDIFVYKLEEAIVDKKKIFFRCQKWQPSLLKVLPPNAPKSYILFWFFHFLRLFKSNKYKAYSILKDNIQICTVVCVPALFRWPFMNQNDIQIKSVFTHPDFRKQGLAYSLLLEILRAEQQENNTIWYMTNESNFASINLCQKLGFTWEGRFKHHKKCFFISIGHIYKKG